jgi:hypothetical protein
MEPAGDGLPPSREHGSFSIKDKILKNPHEATKKLLIPLCGFMALCEHLKNSRNPSRKREGSHMPVTILPHRTIFSRDIFKSSYFLAR